MLRKLRQKCPGMHENPVFQRMLEYSKLEQKASAQNPSQAFKTKGVEYLEQVRTIIALLDRTHAVKNDALLSEEDVRGFLLCVRRFAWFLVVFQQGEQVFQSSLHAKNTRAQLSSIYEKMLSKTRLATPHNEHQSLCPELWAEFKLLVIEIERQTWQKERRDFPNVRLLERFIGAQDTTKEIETATKSIDDLKRRIPYVHAFRLYLKGMQMELDDFYDRVLEPHKRSPHFSEVETLVLC